MFTHKCSETFGSSFKDRNSERRARAAQFPELSTPYLHKFHSEAQNIYTCPKTNVQHSTWPNHRAEKSKVCSNNIKSHFNSQSSACQLKTLVLKFKT